MSNVSSNEEFAVLFAQNHRQVFRYVRALVPVNSDAEEVFQETCVVLWREFGNFTPDSDFLPWALAIAFNQVRSHRHRKRADRLCFSEELVTKLADQRRGMDDEMQLRCDALEHCVGKLRPKDRELINRYYGEKSTAAVVAEQLGRPVNTIYKALQRIRRTLFECVERTIRTQYE